MLAHVLAGLFCPNLNGHRAATGYYDSVFGWVTICLATSPAAAADPGSATGDSNSPQPHRACAAICAAIVAALALTVAFVCAALLAPRSYRLPSWKPSHLVPAVNRLWGSLSVRGPPLVA